MQASGWPGRMHGHFLLLAWRAVRRAHGGSFHYTPTCCSNKMPVPKEICVCQRRAGSKRDMMMCVSKGRAHEWLAALYKDTWQVSRAHGALV